MSTTAHQRGRVEVTTRGTSAARNVLLILSALVTIVLLSAPSLAQQATLTDDTSYPKAGNGGGPAGGQANGQTSQSESSLKVRGAGVATGQATAFVKFKLTGSTPTDIGDLLSGTPGTHVAKATLKLFVSGVGGAGSFDVYRVTGPWTEGSAAAPAYDAASPVATGVQVTAAGSFVTIDITPLVKQWLDYDPNNPAAGGYPNYGIALVASAAAPNTSVEFDSKEATQTSHQAQLGVVLSHAQTADTATNADHATTADNATTANTADALSASASVPGSQVSGDIPGRASSITGSVNGTQVTGAVAEALHAVNADHADTATTATNISAPLTLSSNDPGPTLSVINNGGGAAMRAAGDIDTTTQYKIGGKRVLSIAGESNIFVGVDVGTSSTGGGNAFFGTRAGLANTTGVANAFFGAQAGRSNTTACCNSFFGTDAGRSNTIGGNNSFFGFHAGASNEAGVQNSFYGALAGSNNLTGGNNSFYGFQAGGRNTTGSQNSFFGDSAGFANSTGSLNSSYGFSAGSNNSSGNQNSSFGALAGRSNTTGTSNSFIGGGAGRNNTTGSSNVFVGVSSGLSNTTESGNTFIGTGANGAPGITNATAIGLGAQVTQSHSVVLGNNASVGIGTSAPKQKLEVQGGNILIGSPGQGIILRSPDGATCRLLTIDDAGQIVLTPLSCP